MLFSLVWIDQNYENSTESRSFYRKTAYNILPMKGKESPALPSGGSGKCMKTGLQNCIKK